MTSSGKRPAIRAGIERWQKLGELLQLRRADLGYAARARTRFSGERGINIRRVSDIENVQRKRPDSWTIGTLREIAHVYAITYDSVVAVLRDEADELTPVAPGAPPAPAGLDGNAGLPPTTDAARIAAARPYADQIWMRLFDVATQGITNPSGAEMFGEGTDEARVWDDPYLRRLWPVPERVWRIADLRCRDAGLAQAPP